jgi:plastocyanin
MKLSRLITLITLSCWILVLGAVIAPRAVFAATWQATVGAQSTDEGIQALAFLPNGLWVHVGDSIKWTFAAAEIHTVTFLKQDTNPEQIRPARPGVGPQGGCPHPPGMPNTTPNNSPFDGTTCLTSPEIIVDSPTGNTYTVMFPKAGNFKLVCLVHPNMTSAVHVLAAAESLPFDQAFYDKQAQKRQAELLSDGAGLEGRATATAQQGSGDAVSAGIGEIVATGGGSDTVVVMRFRQDTIVVRVGDTVEWTNLDPVASHTVTFGFPNVDPAPPQSPAPPGVVTLDSDGARHADVNSPTEDVHSGFLVAALQERGPPPPTLLPPEPPPAVAPLPQSPLTVTRFRVTFTKPGTFSYKCILHDDLGMTGRVIVHP